MLKSPQEYTLSRLFTYLRLHEIPISSDISLKLLRVLECALIQEHQQSIEIAVELLKKSISLPSLSIPTATPPLLRSSIRYTGY